MCKLSQRVYSGIYSWFLGRPLSLAKLNGMSNGTVVACPYVTDVLWLNGARQGQGSYSPLIKSRISPCRPSDAAYGRPSLATSGLLVTFNPHAARAWDCDSSTSINEWLWRYHYFNFVRGSDNSTGIVFNIVASLSVFLSVSPLTREPLHLLDEVLHEHVSRQPL